MLYYGSSNVLGYLSSSTKIYNINSYREDIARFPILPPIDRSMYKNSNRDFDVWYAEWIFNNDNVFYIFFSIIMDLYNNIDVFLLIDTEADWSENIIESLLKLIQQRYGYNGILIEDFETYIYAQNNLVSSFDSSYGLYNLDSDKDRYIALTAIYNPQVISRLNKEVYDD